MNGGDAHLGAPWASTSRRTPLCLAAERRSRAMGTRVSPPAAPRAAQNALTIGMRGRNATVGERVYPTEQYEGEPHVPGQSVALLNHDYRVLERDGNQHATCYEERGTSMLSLPPTNELSNIAPHVRTTGKMRHARSPAGTSVFTIIPRKPFTSPRPVIGFSGCQQSGWDLRYAEDSLGGAGPSAQYPRSAQ
eukprot:1191782-Prorocentrum_minimum.AAC.2